MYRKRVQIANATPPNATPLPVDSGDESIDSKVIKLEVPENEEVAAPVISLPPPLPPPPPPSISSSSTESMGESSSAEKLEEGGGARGGAQVDEIKVNDRIKVLYGKGKTLQTYEAKVRTTPTPHPCIHTVQYMLYSTVQYMLILSFGVCVHVHTLTCNCN